MFGCGGVGLGVVAGAAYRGARVIGIDLDDAKAGDGAKAGAAEAINSKTERRARAIDGTDEWARAGRRDRGDWLAGNVSHGGR